MKNRMNIIVAAIIVMLGVTIWMAVRSPKSTIVVAVPSMKVAADPVPRAQSPATTPIGSSTQNPAPVPTIKPTTQPAAGYTAVQGDTLSEVAAGLFGSNTKNNRDATVAANPSLQTNPDRVLDGKTYVPSPPVASPVAAVPSDKPQADLPSPAASLPQVPETTHADSDRVLKYTAQPGDSVSALAAGLLGADSKTNRDAIINENKSLQRDPDRVVAGKAYKIPAGDGLSAAPAAAALPAAPTTQPDADQVVSSGAGRELRYIARAGDTVSKLAEALLGSDTPENRDAIINNNASLKTDPDRVIAGQTYWIPAPVAPVQQP